MDIYPDDYKAITDMLQVGMHRKVPHKNCSSSACLRIGHEVEGISFYCFKCGETSWLSSFNSPAERAKRRAIYEAYQEAKASRSFDIPLDCSQNIPPKGLAWLGAGGWTIDLITRYAVQWSGNLSRVIIPIVSHGSQIGYTARAVESWQRPKYLEKCPDGGMWESESGTHVGEPLDGSSAVICEDILSAGRCGEIMKAYSILGTSLNTKQLSTLMHYDRIYLWLDPDNGGRDGVLSMINRLRMFSEVIIITSEVDPKKLTDKEIRSYLYE